MGIVALSCIRSEREISAALGKFIVSPSRNLLRTDRIETLELLAGIRDVAGGSSPAEINSIQQIQNDHLLSVTDHISFLTKREKEILGGIARGFNNRTIAELLGISLRTVNNHAGMMFLKLGINGDSAMNPRVTATLAFCIYNRLLVESPTSAVLGNASTKWANQGNADIHALG
jgi:hypothetical protein